MDVVTNHFSQDILQEENESTVKEKLNTETLVEPWVTEWTCDDVSVYDTYWNAICQNSPIALENVAEFFHVDGFSFPLSEILTTRGITVLMQKAVEEINEAYDSLSTLNVSNYLKITNFIEFLVNFIEIPLEIIELVIDKLERIRKRVKVMEIAGTALKKNPAYHIALFTWKTSVVVYSRYHELKTTSQDDIEKKIENLLVETSECLVRLHFKFGSVMACQCTIDLLTQLFHVNLTHFFRSFMILFEKSVKGTNELSTATLCVDYKAETMNYFKFFCDCYEFFLSKKAFEAHSEFSSSFLTKIFFIAEKISEKKLVNVCETLTGVLVMWRPSGLDKLKKPTKQFWLQIAQYFEKNQIAHLEHLCKTSASSWTHEIILSFPQCDRSAALLRFIAIMFSEKAIWDVSRNIVQNSLNRMKQFSCNSSLGSRLSLFFAILNICIEPIEFGNRLCDWLSEMCTEKDPLSFDITFNALNVLTDIAEKRKISIKIETVLQKIFDGIPLPSQGSIFINRLTLYTDQRTLSLIDFTRPGKLLNDEDFYKLISLLYQANLTISDLQIGRCLDYMTANKNSDSVIGMTELFVQLLRQGLESNNSAVSQYLAKLIKITLLPDARPEFIFVITNSLLRPPHVVTYLDPFVPCWILASCKFKETHEAEIAEMQKYVWPYVRESLNIGRVENESNDPFDYFTLLFQALENMNEEQLAKKMEMWFPSELVKQLATCSTKVEPRFNNSLKFTLMMLSHLTEALINMAKVTKKSFRHSIFVTLLSTVDNNKEIFQPPMIDSVGEYLMKLIQNIIRVPYEIYLLVRLRQILVNSGQSQLTEKIIKSLREIKNDYYEKLCAEKNPALKMIIEKYP